VSRVRCGCAGGGTALRLRLRGNADSPTADGRTIGIYTFATIAALLDVVGITATVFFALAAIVGHASYTQGDVSAGAFVLTLIGFGLLTLGGWLGGSIVFVYGMRVLSLTDEPALRAAAPVPHPEKEAAEGS
jgi:hypothetical protein